MKLYLIKEFWDESCLPVNNWYEGELTPTMYDPQTLQPAIPSYVVRCNDGKWRKVDTKYFLTAEEWREKKLNELGI